MDSSRFYSNGSRLSLPLLPYERQLIELLGCTAEEYQHFKKQVILKSKERPAEYAHIPDVQNGETALAIVAIVISVGASVASYFLAPKPQVPSDSARRKQRNRTLSSIAGRDRFAPTFGFQAGQDIARFNESIPIVFTKQMYDPLSQSMVGGVMISPKLVWSRSFSWGSFQSIDMMFLVGQGPMARGPYSTSSEIAFDKAGIYLGQTPIDALPESDYRWFYYQGAQPNSNGIGYADDSRLTAAHYRYGTWADNGSANSAFYAPTFNGTVAEGFCHSYSPSTSIQFGAYSAIPNGTPFRLNWEVISIPSEAEDSSKRSARARRVLISGNARMEGIGRNYPRQIGLTKYAGTTTSYAGDNGLVIDNVTVGDKATIVFNKTKLRKKQYEEPYLQNVALSWKGIDHTEIITANEAELEACDDLLQIGTYFLIGNCKFIVESRSPADKIYDRGSTTPVQVELKCVEVFKDSLGFGRIGICNEDYANRDIPLPRTRQDIGIDIGSAWFPVCKVEIANFQNTRKCQYTEIGLKSSVWLRFNGLANFTNVPSWELLESFDDDQVTLRTGTVQSYSRRASFFWLYARPGNASSTDDWVRITDYPLCVAGSTPQEQYNFIRIAHSYEQWEYRLRPITSGELIHIIGRSSNCYRLNASLQFFPPIKTVTKYGTFSVYFKGEQDKIANLALSYEMVNNLTSRDAAFYTTSGIGAEFRNAVLATGAQATPQQLSNVLTKAIENDPDPNAPELPAYQDVPYRGVPVGGTYKFSNSDKDLFSVVQTRSDGKTRSLKVRLTLQSYQGQPVTPGNPRDIFWRIQGIELENVTQNAGFEWSKGDIFIIEKTTFVNDVVKLRFEITGGTSKGLVTYSSDREFEANTAIAEVSHYGDSITRSCDNGPEHEVVYVNESLTPPVVASYNGCAMAGLKIRAGRNFNQLEQLNIYQKNGLQVPLVRRFAAFPARAPYQIGPSNIFTDLVYYLMTNNQAGIGTSVNENMLDVISLEDTSVFLEANALYYDDVITEPQNFREFLSSIAPSLLCNVVTKNGKLSITPALPCNRQGLFDPLVDVPIKAMFTDGNIIEDTFELKYISLDERKPFRAVVRYREQDVNQFPKEKTITVYYNDQADAPVEEFSFTHITSKRHAALVAKYFLAIRRHITHNVSFKAVPYGLVLAPGDFIRVNTQCNIIDPLSNNGVILGDLTDNQANKGFAGGTIVSTVPIADGDHAIYLWDRSNSEVQETLMTVSNNMAFNKENAMFALRNNVTRSEVYVVESLQLDEEGMVVITASYFPLVANSNKSLIASDITSDPLFTISSN